MQLPNLERQAATTPTTALETLLEGNDRFVSGTPAVRGLPDLVAATGEGQWPLAAVLGCIDSRVAPEVVFDQSVGDLFAARIAGNTINSELLGSLEFACKLAGARLIVVLGHSQCGAVKGACDGVEMGHLKATLAPIRDAVERVTLPSDPATRTSGNPSFVQDVAERNVALTLDAIRERSEILRDLESSGAIGLVGAMYDVATGRVKVTVPALG